MLKTLALALLSTLLLAAAPAVDKKLADKDMSAWLTANAASKDAVITGGIGIFIAKGVWKAPGKGPAALKKQKGVLLGCMDKGAKQLKSEGMKALVYEGLFYCALSYGYIAKE